jgi:hypothetical protein
MRESHQKLELATPTPVIDDPGTGPVSPESRIISTHVVLAVSQLE